MNFSYLFTDISWLIAVKDIVVGFGLCAWFLNDPATYCTAHILIGVFILAYSHFYSPAFGAFFYADAYFPIWHLSLGLKGSIDLFYCMTGIPNTSCNYIFTDDGFIIKLSNIQLQNLTEAVYYDRETLHAIYTNMDYISCVDTTLMTLIDLPKLLIL